MERSPETRTLSDYLRAIKARRWLVIGTTLAAIAASILFSVARTPVYEATATISVRSDYNQSQSQSQASTQGAAGREAAAVVTRPAVLVAASRLLGDRTPLAAPIGCDRHRRKGCQCRQHQGEGRYRR